MWHDAKAKIFAWDVILELARKSIILTPHDMAEVMATSTHVTILVDGELRCYGTLGHIRADMGPDTMWSYGEIDRPLTKQVIYYANSFKVLT